MSEKSEILQLVQINEKNHNFITKLQYAIDKYT